MPLAPPFARACKRRRRVPLGSAGSHAPQRARGEPRVSVDLGISKVFEKFSKTLSLPLEGRPRDAAGAALCACAQRVADARFQVALVRASSKGRRESRASL